jgi:ketosteroid isomerase-like protein
MAFSLQTLSDREEIRDLINRWGLAVDVGDFDMFEACYTEDVTLDFREIGYQGTTGPGHREFLEKSAPHFKGMHHALSNTIFSELTAGTARTRTLVFAATVTPGDAVFFIGAWYHDALRKTADGWRISHRRAERVYRHNLPEEYLPRNAPGNRLG